MLLSIPQELRRSLAYDQGKEMARHAELSKNVKIKIYFCDLHSPWQRLTNEKTNGHVRQYLPKGLDLSIYSRSDLEKIAQSLITVTRACLGFKIPEEVFNNKIKRACVAI